MIEFNKHDIEFEDLNFKLIKKWIRFIAQQNVKRIGDITFIFCSDSYLLKINQEYLNHDYFTDIITFNYNELDKISGDIFISIETVKSNSTEYKCSFNDELMRVIIHGVLHLIGFDDTTNDLQDIMTQKENEALLLYLNNFLNK